MIPVTQETAIDGGLYLYSSDRKHWILVQLHASEFVYDWYMTNASTGRLMPTRLRDEHDFKRLSCLPKKIRGIGIIGPIFPV